MAPNRGGTPSPVNLELLYKALSRNKAGVLAAIADTVETIDV